ncbi:MULTISPECIES: hypothetical protein [Methylobacterium]|uniref:hypothetical protein n=1 Tax=Methylobacterium TaxID=407 RepID=UPI0013EB51FC|nr:hypothetical protein [Methylobacterium sp. DB0501]NGM39003.1 hypothetical protein [Methylobacterium sp. DB0501]
MFDTKGDPDPYLDVAAVGIDPLRHNDQDGRKESPDPSKGFDMMECRKADRDVAQAKIDPMPHDLRRAPSTAVPPSAQRPPATATSGRRPGSRSARILRVDRVVRQKVPDLGRRCGRRSLPSGSPSASHPVAEHELLYSVL